MLRQSPDKPIKAKLTFESLFFKNSQKRQKINICRSKREEKYQKFRLSKSWERSVLIFILFSFSVFYLSTYLPVSKSLLAPLPVVSLEIRDRHGILLREVLSDKGGCGHWLKLEEISPFLIKATIAAEDKNFLWHSGINFLSLIRAAWQNFKRGEIVSGGSIITQQLARNLLYHRRNFMAKLKEAWLALRLEHYFSKEKILEQYLNRIYYGHQAYGVEALQGFISENPPLSLPWPKLPFWRFFPVPLPFLTPIVYPAALKKLKNIRKECSTGWPNWASVLPKKSKELWLKK